MDFTSFSPNPPKVQIKSQTEVPTFSQKFFVLISSIILIGGAAYSSLWFKNRGLPVVVSTYTPQPSQSAPPVAGWQTYRNEELGYEIKYPLTFKASLSDTKVLEISENAGDFEHAGLWIYVYDNPKNLTAREWWISSRESDPVNDVIREINISGKVGIEVISPIAFGGEQNTVIAYNNKIYNFLGWLDKQILSTFKFIDKNQFCGGIATFQCPDGYTCLFDGNYPDAGGHCVKDDNKICIQVITPARNTQTGEIKEFPTPCDVPEGWEKL